MGSIRRAFELHEQAVEDSRYSALDFPDLDLRSAEREHTLRNGFLDSDERSFEIERNLAATFFHSFSRNALTTRVTILVWRATPAASMKRGFRAFWKEHRRARGSYRARFVSERVSVTG